MFSFTRANSIYTRAGAQSASTLNFQARLLNANGSIVSDGTYSVEFKLYDVSTGGTALWTETQSTVTVKGGYMSVYLASNTAFPGTIDWSQQHWLTMNVNGDGEMSPRIRLTAVPYAFRANQADSLTDGTSTITAEGLLKKAPLNLQSLTSSVAGLRFNQTGSGGLIQLQGDGSDVFTVDKLGNGVFGGSLTTGGALTVSLGGASITGGLNNNSGGITNAGSITGVGANITGSGALTIGSSGGSSPLTLNSGSGAVVLGASTLQSSGAGLTIDVNNAGLSTLNIVNSNGSSLADLDVEGAIFAGNGNAFSVSSKGDITSVFTQLDGSSTASLGSGSGSSSSLTLVSAIDFDVGNYVQINSTDCSGSGVNVCYAKITAKSVNTLTIAPALSWAAGATVNEYHVPEIGGSNISESLASRYGRGYFISGIATGNGTTYYEEGGISTTLSAFSLLNSGVQKLNIGGDATEINVGNAASAVNILGTLQTASTELVIAGGGIKVLEGGANITGNSNFIGTVDMSSSLTVSAGGASITGGLNNNSGGITNAGALSGVTTLSMSGGISAATAANTINGLVINAGALSSVNGITFIGGSLNLASGGITNAGSITGATTITASGNINTTGVYQKDGVSGIDVAACAGDEYIGNGVRVSGGIITGGSCRTDANTLSDIRLKENIIELGSTLDKIKGLNVYTYDFKCQNPEYADLYLDCKRQTGVIAQELEAIFPDLVITREDGYKEVNLRALSFYNLKAVTEVASRLDSKGNAKLSTVSTDGTLRLTRSGTLKNINGLNIVSNGASIVGGLNNNGGGIKNAGQLSGVSTVDAKSITLNGGSDGNLLTLKKDGKGVFTVFNNGALELKTDSAAAFTVMNAAGGTYFNIDTEGNLVSIGSAQGDSKAILFVLDSKNTEGDPEGVNGAQYYNSAANRFRCFQDGRWQDCLPAANADYVISSQPVSWIQKAEEQTLPDNPKVWVDLTNARESRLMVQVASGAGSAECWLQYALEAGGLWRNLFADDEERSLLLDKQGVLKTSWNDIVAEARTEVLVQIVCSDGDGISLVKVLNSRIQVR